MKSPAFEITNLVICHPKWLYLHAGIIDAGAQTKIVEDLFLLWKGHFAYRIKTNFTTSYVSYIHCEQNHPFK